MGEGTWKGHQSQGQWLDWVLLLVSSPMACLSQAPGSWLWEGSEAASILGVVISCDGAVSQACWV